MGRIVLRIGFSDIGCTKTVFRKLNFLGLFICYQGCFRLTSLIFWPCSEFFLGINAFLTNYPGLSYVRALPLFKHYIINFMIYYQTPQPSEGFSQYLVGQCQIKLISHHLRILDDLQLRKW